MGQTPEEMGLGARLAVGGFATAMGLTVLSVASGFLLVGLLSILHWVAFGYGALLFDGHFLGAIPGKWGKGMQEGWPRRIASGTSAVLIVVPLAPFLVLLVLSGVLKTAWEKATNR